jgi:DNA-binding LacI/PurR family transcriptional regulator/DNA-binding CsgD family transcriptional regulator
MPAMIDLLVKTRPTLGLMISHLDGSYQQEFWQGMDQFCQEADYDLFLFITHFWRDQYEGYLAQERFHQLVAGSLLDGLCIDSTSFWDDTRLAQFVQGTPKLQGIPLVLASTRIPHLPSLVPDNRDGIRKALDHLTQAHNCKRIAYVGGPSGIEDARVRKDAFYEYMAEHGLALEGELIFEGNFDNPSGRAAMKSLLTLGPLPDAVVFANDEMALGGMDFLRSQGIAIPGRIRITGFDNIDQAADFDPPLASVSQSQAEKGRIAGRRLSEAIEGHPLKALEMLPVSFVPRDSCGCVGLPPASPGKVGSRMPGLRFSGLEKSFYCLKRITEYLASVMALVDLEKNLGTLVSNIQLGAIYISLYEDQGDHANLILAIDGNGKSLVTSDSHRRFLASQVVPSYLLSKTERRTFVVQSLDKGSSTFGFMATELVLNDPIVHVFLREHLNEVLVKILSTQVMDRENTRLKQRVAELESSEGHLRSLVRTLPLLVLETDQSGRLSYFNQKAGEFFKLGMDDLGNRDVSDLFSPAMQPSERSQKPATFSIWKLNPEKPLVRELMGQSLDSDTGGRIWVALDYHSIFRSNDSPLRAFFDTYRLTRRESEIIGLELENRSAKEIAAILEISISTVKGHVAAAYHKLDVRTREQLFARFRKTLVESYGNNDLILSLVSEMLKG